MPKRVSTAVADGGQRRASFQRARSHETKRALVQAAMALWRTNGYAKTTVADICRAAGVSRALFYFYFPAKEDILFEVGLLSTRAAQQKVRSLLRTDYDVESVIGEALRSLERSMVRNPRDLIVETILEGYRQQHRILAGERTDDTDADMFGELFTQAQRDGKLAAHVDVAHLSHLARMHVSEGVRHWAAGTFGQKPFAEVVAADIAALINGFNTRPGR
ncbi:TetR/AcrR family transcriptional regulator [Mycolicibacterium holsaticum]|uniref:TetR family transcriptional regulator n=1 Tax=Mycolicibacterium holsaticum TaxID=152142 RepID=A0A1E3RXQ4_9MYCO|nr:TetR/AcrR family transcriptional regulator [Mycolicibacterium holsaticum]MDA4107284.1 TetR family transcriptional regulator [Mycolicibacterium holsaticum DSM 44478 = JCM 12374]ODQ94212.1 TetR family transcriptional regulator [Mycolicibacterium holsaticum]QZA14120.1 TetR/AcrR family transcriptional regulator [Mycolicibacterium holsaticum DSM 44478 = JCM 12374]UNC08425.1 TetR/AcrR family transcriptional regulator [Mycolicibacterium holsaticum DSM 44478 = JCM 12374]